MFLVLSWNGCLVLFYYCASGVPKIRYEKGLAGPCLGLRLLLEVLSEQISLSESYCAVPHGFVWEGGLRKARVFSKGVKY